MSEPTMRSQLIGPALRSVAAAGGDAVAMARRFGLDASAVDAPDAVLPLPALEALFTACASEAGLPSLGVALAERAQTGTFGVAEYACRNAPDLREAFRRASRYIGLLNDLVRIDVTPGDDDTVSIEQRVPGRPLALGRHANEFFVVYLLAMVRRLTGTATTAIRGWVAHPVPTDREALVRALGTPALRFGAGGNGVALARNLLDHALLSADPNLLRIMDHEAERALRTRGNPSHERAAIRSAIRERLDGGTPNVAEVAERLSMSPRTLQRRLREEGTSFQAELDMVRAQLAEVYMADASLSLSEVAFLLGYADHSAFGRAYRRWTGKRPTDARGAIGSA